LETEQKKIMSDDMFNYRNTVGLNDCTEQKDEQIKYYSYSIVCTATTKCSQIITLIKMSANDLYE